MEFSPAKPLLTYLGSSRTIAPDEHLFLWRWIAALRTAKDPLLRECNIFVRPHPHNTVIWDHWPKVAPKRVKSLGMGMAMMYRVIDSVSHTEAVIGINTTAMLEAAALNKPVLTVLDEALSVGQTQRLHFRYLTDGLVTASNSLEEHVNQLTKILHGDTSFGSKSEKFANTFLRPPWPFRSPVKAFQRAVEQFAWSPYPRPLGAKVLPILLRPVAAWLAHKLEAEPAADAGFPRPVQVPQMQPERIKVIELAR